MSVVGWFVMEILKFGVIGFIIMLPFIFVGMFSSQQNYYEQRMLQLIKGQIEEATYDAAFAMKTYGETYYDSEDAYNIEIPYEQVIQVFYTSLDMRDFNYSKKDFPFFMFIDYDGVILYNPTSEEFLPKMYYIHREENFISYYNLGDIVTVYNALTDEKVEDLVDELKREQVILKTIETALNKGSIFNERCSNYFFELPIQDNSFNKLAINDLSFTVFYLSEEYYGLGFTEYMAMKPSGVLKMKEIIAY